MPPTKRKPKRRRPSAADSRRKKKVCAFCRTRGDDIPVVDYKDVAMLRKFISDRGKIRARRVTGNCGKHQREVSIAIKNAREMALLPYTATRS